MATERKFTLVRFIPRTGEGIIRFGEDEYYILLPAGQNCDCDLSSYDRLHTTLQIRDIKFVNKIDREVVFKRVVRGSEPMVNTRVALSVCGHAFWGQLDSGWP